MDGAEWWADQKHALQYVLGKTDNERQGNKCIPNKKSNK